MTTRTYRTIDSHQRRHRFSVVCTAALAAALVWVAGCSGGDADDGDGGDVGADADAPTIVEACGAEARQHGSTMDAGGDAGSMADAFDAMDVGVDAASSDAGMAGYPPLPASFSYESEYSMRFTDFQFAESSTGSSVNFAIENFLDQKKPYPIVVLMHFRDFDLEAGAVELRGGAGVKVDKDCVPSDRPSGECNYDWDPNTPDRYRGIQLDPETGELDGGLESLKFVARTEIEGEVKVTNITIRDLVFTNAALRPTESGDGVAIDSGILEGYITYDDAADATVKLSSGVGIPVADLLKESQLNYDSDGDGELDAWCMEGTFSAKETNVVE